MDPLKVRRIRTPENPRSKRRKFVHADTSWDNREGIQKKRFGPLMWLPLLAAVVLLAGIGGAGLFKSRMQSDAPTPHRAAPPPVAITQAEQETAQKEAKIALDCIAQFFGSPNDLRKIAQCRPVPALVKLYQDHKDEIAGLAEATPLPGGNLKRKPPFIGIPISFVSRRPRTAWVEIRGNTARLDLESFVGHGAVPWPELENAAAGTNIFLRGTLVPIDGRDGLMDLVSPDGKTSIRITGGKPAELTSPRPARVTVARVAETAVVRPGWTLISLEGWDWLAEPHENPAEQ